MDGLKLDARVVERIVETPDVVTIRFVVDGEFSYDAGQYISVYFDDTGVKAGKAYSLSSHPGDEVPSITVKKVGLFSGRLHDLGVSDSIKISQPYGFFHAYQDRPIVAIAAGVGISPVWSVIRHELAGGLAEPVRLLYGGKTDEDIIFRTAMKELKGECDNFSYQHFVTRQPDTRHTARRIDLAQDLAEIGGGECFYICGTQDFVRSMRGQLVGLGVSDDDISTETFFEVQV